MKTVKNHNKQQAIKNHTTEETEKILGTVVLFGTWESQSSKKQLIVPHPSLLSS